MSSILNIQQIMKLIPHRYPFLLIDKIISIESGIKAVALKNVTVNENFFVGHFPIKPVMPGVLIIEAMAQAAAVFLIHDTKAEMNNKLIYFTSIENAKFRKPVEPGDTMIIEVSKIQSRSSMWKIKGEVRVNDTLVTEAIVSAVLVDVEDK
ncbi:MAG: 3-hydroxyacyl-ACP dehydratase FabZ [Candidatus Midichloria mitochondrii]|uniref:3-hydroxyacyl-[acyl-carrier-protein] dehydratase FabZ n=1 Tax=Midichloria mitochondrii (strain IricVA) TaxID=696127 RepID=F7XTP7_MIDMI|nr:3-hydroxyacyl-ACP dehydratase FabZ [Candidatus Midichloria mitochondrii]AEI89256.1 3-hydroxymyristoyl-ACP dehydratase [Candidatus Midichloria mitochondrii IricVA]MDJ1298844.1 3-hydroxyacyl-ACP dehydratase FabZ [Candidatus Midichloria mitochondrii]MDJ1583343.1 3-hydroxyacyl-ACP dehydratase FabZ [Candidatus Midichloria mitochondrii]